MVSGAYALGLFGPGFPKGPGPLPNAPSQAQVTGLAPPPVLRERVVKVRPSRPVAELGCGPWLTTKAMPGAAILVNVAAPCQPGAPVSVRHSRLETSGETDGDGHFSVLLPALEQKAEVEIALSGEVHAQRIDVPSAAAFQHVILQWTGGQVLEMHAYEFGAGKSQMGHVWAGAPKTPVWAARGTGGYLTRLENGTGSASEVYSFPAGQSPLRGVVRLVVEAKVTADTCGKHAFGTALQTSPLGGLRETEIAVEMPECDKIGETVQLQNLLQDMRLAGR